MRYEILFRMLRSDRAKLISVNRWDSYVLRKPERGVECRSSRIIPRLRST